MRTLYIAYTDYFRDPRAIRTCEALADAGCHVVALTLGDGEPARSGPGNRVEIRPVGVPKYQGTAPWRYLWSYGRFFLRVRAAIRRVGPVDACVVKNMPNLLVFTAAALRREGVPIFLDIRDSMADVFRSKFPFLSPLGSLLVLEERWSAAWATHVFCAHEPHRQLCISHGIPGGRLTPVLNLPDERLWRGVRHEPVAPFTVLYNGLVSRRTGSDLLLEAFARARGRVGQPLRLVLVGPGELYPWLRRRAGELGLGADEVVFVEGGVATEEMPRYVSRASVMVIPQRGDGVGRIGLPRKLLEAAYVGLPVVVSRSPAIEYYFSDDMVCYVPPDDLDALARALVRLVEDGEERRRLARKIRGFAARYSWEREKRRLTDVICGWGRRRGERRAPPPVEPR